jgi:hypothetical protein
MIPPLFYGNRLNSFCFVFVRAEISDAEFLRHFGLGAYRPVGQVDGLYRYAIVASLNGWRVLADDVCFTFWHMSQRRTAIEALGRQFDLWACSAGDCDMSYDFVLYRQGTLRRKYVVDSPRFTDRIVREEFGLPLPGEAEVVTPEADGMEICWQLAISLGIPTNLRESELRFFAP